MSWLARVRQLLGAIILVFCTSSAVALSLRATGVASTHIKVIRVGACSTSLQLNALSLLAPATGGFLRPINLNSCSLSVPVLQEGSASSLQFEDRPADFTKLPTQPARKSSSRSLLAL